MTKRFRGIVAATLSATVFLTGACVCARPDRPPTPLQGAWSYSNSASHDGTSSSESLSAAENAQAGSGFADIKVEEMANGTTHTRRQSRVRYRDVNAVMEALIAQARMGL